MLNPPPDMYPGCTWADQPIEDTADSTSFGIGTAATVEPRTGLTTRYRVSAYDPQAGMVTVTPDIKEDRSGVARPAPDRSLPRTVPLADLDELRLIHRRDRNGGTGLHTNHCRHTIKSAFTAGGDQGVPAHRRVYRLWMQTTEGRTYRFLVRAPSQTTAFDVARDWWQGTPSPDGWIGGHLEEGERIEVLTFEGARDMQVWPYPDPIADPI